MFKPLRIPQGTSPAFSIVDPAGTWAWRSGPVDAAAVRQGAVLALLPAEAAVAELPRRAEAAAAAVESPRRAEAAELAPCVAAELPWRAEAAYQRRRYPRCPVTVR